MRFVKRSRVLMTVLLAAACGRPDGDTRDTLAAAATVPPDVDASAAHALFACLEGDSAVYVDASMGDDSGVRLDLWHAGDGIDGMSTAGAGEARQTVPLARLELLGRDSIRLAIAHGESAPDTTVFVGRVSCDSLSGRQRVDRRAPEQAASYHRLRGAAPE
ncbi:MAG TPA: hypothetical protein VFY16_03875 [Gemmatimonadaceae bacterium]|nr:hypothetical protein [Gemmatimonadaceae bacterium]